MITGQNEDILRNAYAVGLAKAQELGAEGELAAMRAWLAVREAMDDTHENRVVMKTISDEIVREFRE